MSVLSDRSPPTKWPSQGTDSLTVNDPATITALASAIATVLTAAAVLVRAWRAEESEEHR
jgi:hypothetical protein